MEEKQTVKKNDFIEIKFSGFANEKIFDSNIEEDLKTLNPEAKSEKVIIAIGQKMLVPGLDKKLEGKELNKEYEIDIPSNEAFGPRDRNLLRTIPLKAFTQQKISPFPGMMLTLDNSLVKIIAVSGARVTTDFNNPLAGKDLKYKITITRKVTDDKEKSESLLKMFLKFLPELEVKEKEVVVKGPKILEGVIGMYKEKFKELIGKELVFEEKKEEPEEKKEESKTENNEQSH
ncbi:MAG: FKBP-type peptidyl-prolyl cis-trans isomerase [Nanoarchaeota archaeon]|nr:FKBP-type peptidyl-prolyl cis-trans isomerase [Nanoarchaeota archaeon]MBU1103677.1 FKBP-type peptidyl-prolyl cis-trans isomerase [Nanoarchaeota archaeon]